MYFPEEKVSSDSNTKFTKTKKFRNQSNCPSCIKDAILLLAVVPTRVEAFLIRASLVGNGSIFNSGVSSVCLGCLIPSLELEPFDK